MKKAATTKKSAVKKEQEATASSKRVARDKDASNWRSERIAQIRMLINAADPEIVETAKWRKPSNAMKGVPVWEKDGIICTGETYKDKVKLTFANGAALKDPAKLFNASLDGGVRRAIDIRGGDRIDAKAFKALIRAAAAENVARAAARPTRSRKG